jgi:hypothetical protein
MNAYELIGKLPRPKRGFVLPSHHYTGPYNPLDKQLDKNNVPLPGQEPFNEVDKLSLNHDICYRDGQLTKTQCDDELLEQLNKLNPKNSRENIDKNFVRTAVGLKRNLDNASPLCSRGGGMQKRKMTLKINFSKDPIIRNYLTKLNMEKIGFSLNDKINKQRSSENFQNNNMLYQNAERSIPHPFWNSNPNQDTNKNAYVSSMIDFDFNKVNLQSRLTSKLPQQEHGNPNMTALALSMNNPYMLIESNQESSLDQQSDSNDENQFLSILIDLQQLYTNDSFSNNVKNSRNKMLNILINFFDKYNANNDYWLDDKQCLCYRKLHTGVKFQLYVDYFVKQYDPSRSKSNPPMYFNELFMGIIFNSQTKFSPTIQHSSKITKRYKKTKKTNNRKLADSYKRKLSVNK